MDIKSQNYKVFSKDTFNITFNILKDVSSKYNFSANSEYLKLTLEVSQQTFTI